MPPRVPPAYNPRPRLRGNALSRRPPRDQLSPGQVMKGEGTPAVSTFDSDSKERTREPMGTTATETGSTFKPCPAGVHDATCVVVADIGTHLKDYPDGKKEKHRVLLAWEIDDLRTDDDEPFIVTRQFNLSLHENSGLRPFLEAWRGRSFTEKELHAFDVKNVLGAPCQLNVVHQKSDKNGQTYANASSAIPLGKKSARPTPTLALLHVDLDEHREIDPTWPKYVSNAIRKSEDFRRGLIADPPSEEDDNRPTGVGAAMGPDPNPDGAEDDDPPPF